MLMRIFKSILNSSYSRNITLYSPLIKNKARHRENQNAQQTLIVAVFM